ncbi:hypothetical protein KBD71_02620 [Candidatus Woesebacteria bacterium]|nr:hypothetical protein [Candidatus Woesebacteria bacterium]
MQRILLLIGRTRFHCWIQACAACDCLQFKHGLAVCVTISLLACSISTAHAVTTLLVNTESFQSIDSGDASTNVELRFGASNQTVSWNVIKSQFDFSHTINTAGNITASGGLAIEQNIRTKGNFTLNSDNDSSDAILTFGNTTLAQTLTYIHSTQKFRFSTSVDVAGTMSGYALTVSGLRNCDTIDTDSSGVLTCGTDGGGGGGLSQTDGDARYVKKSGDTMTGALTVRGTISGSLLRASNMTLSGAVVYSSGSSLRQTAKGMSGQVLISQATSAPKWASPIGSMIWYFDGTQAVATAKGPRITMPFGLTLSGVTLDAKGAPTGAALIVNIHTNGSTIFATRPQIIAGATRGGTGAVLSTTSLQSNDVITVNIDQVGSTFAGSGVTVILKGTRKY